MGNREDVDVVPKSWVGEAIDSLHKLLSGRGAQYAVSGEFENFLEQSRVGEQTIRQVFRGALAQKLSRERTQNMGAYDTTDSVADIAGYAVLWYAYILSQRTEKARE